MLWRGVPVPRDTACWTSGAFGDKVHTPDADTLFRPLVGLRGADFEELVANGVGEVSGTNCRRLEGRRRRVRFDASLASNLPSTTHHGGRQAAERRTSLR
jgi:hypothetical protein